MEGFSPWMLLIPVLLMVFYIGGLVAVYLLMIFGCRANWNGDRSVIKKVEFVGFWRRVAIQQVDKLLCLFIIPVFFNLFYYLRDGQTIADKIYGTRLVDAQTSKKAEVGKLIVRVFAKLLSILGLGLGFMWAGWTAEKKAWHDSLSDTRYVATREVSGWWTFAGIIIPMIIAAALVLMIMKVVLAALYSAGLGPDMMQSLPQ